MENVQGGTWWMMGVFCAATYLAGANATTQFEMNWYFDEYMQYCVV